MMTAKKTIAVALCIAVAGLPDPAGAEMFASSDGWHSWQTDEPGAITEACCFDWRHGSPATAGCNLDGRSVRYSSDGQCAAGPGRAQYYVLMENGKPQEVLVLSEACPVESAAQIIDHGVLPAEENIAWFRQVIENPTLDADVREEALFALVQSESSLAFDYLDQLLSQR